MGPQLIVVDTNVIAYSVMASEQAPAAERLLSTDRHWAAPVLWRSEFRNFLALHVRRRGLPVQVAFDLMAIAEERMQNHEYNVSSEAVIRCSAESGLSAYDCEFVVLAQTLSVPLVTADRKVARAFPERARLLSEF